MLPVKTVHGPRQGCVCIRLAQARLYARRLEEAKSVSHGAQHTLQGRLYHRHPVKNSAVERIVLSSRVDSYHTFAVCVCVHLFIFFFFLALQVGIMAVQ